MDHGRFPEFCLLYPAVFSFIRQGTQNVSLPLQVRRNSNLNDSQVAGIGNFRGRFLCDPKHRHRQQIP